MWSRVSSTVSVNCWFMLSAYKGYRPKQIVPENVEVLCAASCWAYNRDQRGIGRLALAMPQSSELHECHHTDGHLLQIILGDINVILESQGLTKRDVAMHHIKTSRADEQKESQAAISIFCEEANTP